MSREVPKGWRAGKLDTFITLQRGFDLPVQNRRQGTFAVIASNGQIDSHSEPRIPGPAVVTGRSGTLGKVFYMSEGCWPLNTTLYVKDFHGNDPEFVTWFLKHFKLERFGTGTGVPTLNRNVVHEEEVVLPPLHEQRRIAEILSSVDEAIAATRAVIEQTRKVKQVALETLLHRGNWSEADLPPGHRLIRLEDLAQRGSGHTPSKNFSEYWNGGIPWISLQDTKFLDRRYVRKSAVEISEAGIKNSSAVVHPAGTVFVSRDATVGKVGIMKVPMAVSQHFIAWRCGPSLDNIFLYYWLLNMRPIFDRIAAGSTIKTIGLGFFKGLSIAIPDLLTQQNIAAEMMSLDDGIDSYEASLRGLASVKSALMSDLLTGRKRVTEFLPMAAE